MFCKERSEESPNNLEPHSRRSQQAAIRTKSLPSADVCFWGTPGGQTQGTSASKRFP